MHGVGRLDREKRPGNGTAAEGDLPPQAGLAGGDALLHHPARVRGQNLPQLRPSEGLGQDPGGLVAVTDLPRRGKLDDRIGVELGKGRLPLHFLFGHFAGGDVPDDRLQQELVIHLDPIQADFGVEHGAVEPARLPLEGHRLSGRRGGNEFRRQFERRAVARLDFRRKMSRRVGEDLLAAGAEHLQRPGIAVDQPAVPENEDRLLGGLKEGLVAFLAHPHALLRRQQPFAFGQEHALPHHGQDDDHRAAEAE